MAPPSYHHHNPSQTTSFSRPSILPAASSMNPPSSSTKTRQYAQLHSQLTQLNSHLGDTENLLRMTAVQAEDMRFLGGYVGALFMGSAKVLGEEGVVKESAVGGDGNGSGNGSDGSDEDGIGKS